MAWFSIISGYLLIGSLLARRSTGIAAFIYITICWPLAFVPWERLGLD